MSRLFVLPGFLCAAVPPADPEDSQDRFEVVPAPSGFVGGLVPGCRSHHGVVKAGFRVFPPPSPRHLRRIPILAATSRRPMPTTSHLAWLARQARIACSRRGRLRRICARSSLCLRLRSWRAAWRGTCRTYKECLPWFTSPFAGVLLASSTGPPCRTVSSSSHATYLRNWAGVDGVRSRSHRHRTYHDTPSPGAAWRSVMRATAQRRSRGWSSRASSQNRRHAGSVAAHAGGA